MHDAMVETLKLLQLLIKLEMISLKSEWANLTSITYC